MRKVWLNVAPDSPDIHQRVGFLLGIGLRLLQHVPHARQHERQDHGIGRSDDGNNRSGEVVRLFARVRGRGPRHDEEKRQGCNTRRPR